MKFLTLTIEHFLAIAEAKIGLGDRGLCLIQGVNDENSSASSNGAGKSSIADALCWALYGVTARGVSGDDVINADAGKGTKVMVDLEDGEDVYRIARHRKHKTGKNAVTLMCLKKDGTINDLTKGTDKLTQAEVEKLLGCSYEVFRAAVYAGQEQMMDLPAMTDKQLKVLVEEAAGVTVLEAAYKEAQTRCRTAKEEVERLEAKIATATQFEAHLQKLRLGEDAARITWGNTREAKVKLLTAQARDALAKSKAPVPDKKAFEDELAQIQAALAGVEGEKETLDELTDALAKAQSRVAAARATLERQVSLAKYELESLQKIAARVGTPCGECAKPYCEHDLEAARQLQSAKADDARKKAVALKASLDAASSELEHARQRVEVHRASMTDVSAQTLRAQALNEELRKIAKIESEVEGWKRQTASFARLLKEAREEQNPHLKRLEEISADILDVSKNITALTKETGEARGALEIAEAVVKVFSPAGVRAHILDEVTPFLNDQTAKYLGTLTDGNTTATWTTLVINGKGEYREKFSIEVKDEGGGSSFAALSGGEKRKVRIATALALQDLVARRATKPIDLWIGDEIDDALDDPGLERLMAILEEKAKERGSVFVISHRSLRDWISNVITVTKTGKRATITEEAS